MTVAWYGHLKFKSAPLVAAIFVSWLIALPEYILQVPANRLGHAEESDQAAADRDPVAGTHTWWRAQLSAPQLKILQEVITISVFVVFNFLWLQERIRATDWAAFVLIILAVVVMMYPRIMAARAEAKTAAGPPMVVPEILAMEPVDGREEA
jgi:hypothetical protein